MTGLRVRVVIDSPSTTGQRKRFCEGLAVHIAERIWPQTRRPEQPQIELDQIFIDDEVEMNGDCWPDEDFFDIACWTDNAWTVLDVTLGRALGGDQDNAFSGMLVQNLELALIPQHFYEEHRIYLHMHDHEWEDQCSCEGDYDPTQRAYGLGARSTRAANTLIKETKTGSAYFASNIYADQAQ